MIIVTGGAGFIGSNIVKALNERGIDDILVVDHLKDGSKFLNLADCEIADYLDRDDFIAMLDNGTDFGTLEAVFHEGACSATTEWDGQYMMRNNFEYSKRMLQLCIEKQASLLYASSASVYGDGPVFSEQRQYERPKNVYAYSKFLFDQYIRRVLPKASSQIVGFRFFNVYGPREQHKGSMSSVAWHFHHQLSETGVAKLFEGCDGYGNGEQRRDFIYVSDAVAVNLWFLDHPEQSGIFNLGTGSSQSFNDVANAVVSWHGRGKLEYIPFPTHLLGRYQSFTEADISALRQAGCDVTFRTVEQGVTAYLDWLRDTQESPAK